MEKEEDRVAQIKICVQQLRQMQLLSVTVVDFTFDCNSNMDMAQQGKDHKSIGCHENQTVYSVPL